MLHVKLPKLAVRTDTLGLTQLQGKLITFLFHYRSVDGNVVTSGKLEPVKKRVCNILMYSTL